VGFRQQVEDGDAVGVELVHHLVQDTVMEVVGHRVHQHVQPPKVMEEVLISYVAYVQDHVGHVFYYNKCKSFPRVPGVFGNINPLSTKTPPLLTLDLEVIMEFWCFHGVHGVFWGDNREKRF
jgi:hypothetical protein